MVRGRPTADMVIPDFMHFIRDSVLVAYNAGFDLGFLECCMSLAWGMISRYYIIDALRLARRVFPDIGRYNLGSVADELGIGSDSGHRALPDAITTWKVFDAELRALKSQGIHTVEEVGYIPASSRPYLSAVKDCRIGLIESAILKRKRLNIVYRSLWSNAVTERTITPKKIHRGYDSLYVVAWCHAKNADRNFRVDCIIDAKAHR
jgi:DNA polymerase-3 subunit alpha (Gram-positive type)